MHSISSGCNGARAGGFSLLEMLVAISILALSLGVLYEAVSGATRNVRTDEKYAYGVELARSLLAENARVPVSGTHSRGETAGGFSWYVAAAPMRPEKLNLSDGALQEIEVAVSWQDGRKRRRVVLHSIVEGYRP
jgi:general secretion pathway protein I